MTYAPLARLLTSSATTGLVRYPTANGTAVAGSDYAAVDQFVTLPTGSTNGATQPAPVSGLTALGANPTPNFQPDAAYTVAGTGDFNQDGKTDILWWHHVNGTLQVWLMNGVVQTSSSPTTPAGVVDLNWQVAGTGDFNLDGKPDILWRNATSGRFVAWLMDGLTRTSGTFLVPEMLTDLNWRVMSSRDMDGDGKTDLVWQHQVSHRVVIWFMDGIYRRSGTLTSPDGGAMTTWVVAGPR